MMIMLENTDELCRSLVGCTFLLGVSASIHNFYLIGGQKVSWDFLLTTLLVISLVSYATAYSMRLFTGMILYSRNTGGLAVYLCSYQ